MMITLSAIGFILSVLANTLSLLNFELSNYWFALHIGIFVVWFPVVFHSTKQFKGKRFSWSEALGKRPLWMYAVLFALIPYVVFNFISQAPAQGEKASIALFSGHWLIFYYVALMMHLNFRDLKMRTEPS